MRTSAVGRVLHRLVVALVVTLASASWVGAEPQTKDQRSCTGTMNQALARVSAATAGEVAGCTLEASRGKLVGTIAACSTADRKQKIAKALDKAASDFSAKCSGSSRNPAGVPRKPPYGVTDAATAGDAAGAGARTLFHDVLGADLDAGVLREADGKDAARCQQLLARDLRACQATLLREFNRCKKAGLSSKTAPFDDAADLAGCFGADPKEMIAKRCDREVEVRPGRFQVDGLRKTLADKCAAKGVDLTQALPGCAAGDVGSAHGCLERAARCRACQALAAGDALGLDCDALDDGTANASCAAPLGRLACALDPDSSFFFESAGGFLGGTINGTVNVDCGVIDAATGTAACSCALADVVPVEVPGTGWACAAPVAGCSAGSIACDGGTSLDFTIAADHDIGACDGNAGCAAQCGSACAAASAEVWDSGCEGFCEGGSNDGGTCTSAAQCAGGRCNGVAGGAHGNVCQCQCIERDGAPSMPGGLRCDLGVRVRVEAALPCDGADVLLDVGDRCLPFTTETAQATLTDQDHVAGANLPGGTDLVGGLALECDTLRDAGAGGMLLISAANAFDLPGTGDVYLLFALGCD